MKTSGVSTKGKINLNDWHKEGWEDLTPKKSNGKSIFTGQLNNQVALNDWWGEGWTKSTV